MTSPAKLRNKVNILLEEFADIEFAEKIFIPGQTPVPASGKLVGVEEVQFMVQAAMDCWLTAGRFNAEFEAKLADFIGIRNVITVNSGSSANLVAFSTLTSERLGERRIKPGDEVITVAAGFPTTVNPIIQAGCIPVFVDIDPATHNIDADLIEQAISKKTRAIMVAHTLGNPFDAGRIKKICDQYGLWLIEDCCDALGSIVDGKMVGTWGDLATLSFYPAHHLTMGEGGAVFSNSDELISIAESFRDWGRDCYCPPGKDNTCGRRFEQKLGELPQGYDHKYTYSHIGYNLKISDMQAACGLAQLRKLPDFIKKRKENFKYLSSSIRELSSFIEVAQPTPGSDPSWFGLPLTLTPDSGVNRVDLLRFLDQSKVGTRLIFAGNLTRQPAYLGKKFRVAGSLKHTDNTMARSFWVGVQPALTKSHLDYTSRVMKEFFGTGF